MVSLSLQKLGLPIQFILGMLDLIERMVHNIRAGYRDSEATYGSNEIAPQIKHHLQGLNQGNGEGPTIWPIVSSMILSILHSKGYSTEFISSISKATLRLIGFSYMDDCNLFSSGDSASDTFKQMQQSLLHWEALIKVTRGCLVLNKS